MVSTFEMELEYLWQALNLTETKPSDLLSLPPGSDLAALP
jgi:hypothetical protein